MRLVGDLCLWLRELRRGETRKGLSQALTHSVLSCSVFSLCMKTARTTYSLRSINNNLSVPLTVTFAQWLCQISEPPWRTPWEKEEEGVFWSSDAQWEAIVTLIRSHRVHVVYVNLAVPLESTLLNHVNASQCNNSVVVDTSNCHTHISGPSSSKTTCHKADDQLLLSQSSLWLFTTVDSRPLPCILHTQQQGRHKWQYSQMNQKNYQESVLAHLK